MEFTIEENFQQAELLNRDVLLTIHKMNQNHESSIRLALVDESLKLINSFNDLLTINEFKIRQLVGPSIEELFQLDKYKSILSDLKLHLRSAQLESKKREDIFERKERVEYLKNVFVAEEEEGGIDEKRAELFTFSNQGDVPKKTQAQILLQKNREVTSKFLKTRQLLEASAFQSNVMLENFEESTQKLLYMNDSFDTMNVLLDRAKSLVKSLNKLGTKQRTQVKYSLYFFVGCCAFVMLRRAFGVVSKIYWLVSLPIRIILLPFKFVFLLLKLFIGSGDTIEQAEDILGLTESFLTETATSINVILATTTSSLVSSMTSSAFEVEGYEELSKQLSSIINDEEGSSTVIGTVLTTAANRIVDEL